MGTDPLVDDFRVTVFFNAVRIDDDGDWDPGDEDDDFGFDLGLRLPGTGPAGLGSYTSVVRDTVALTDPFQVALALTTQQVEPLLPNGARGDQALENDQSSRGIAFDGDGGGSTLTLARYLPAARRSVAFGMTADQSFDVEGVVAELDLLDRRPANSSFLDYRLVFRGEDSMQTTSGGDGATYGGYVSFTIFVG